MPKSKIPDRWESYSKMGKIIADTMIMTMKVPLRESLTSSLPPEERFSPALLLRLIQEQKLKLGGIVDLTFTTRYYDSQFFLQNGIGYKKVFTAGHVVPSNKTYHEFSSAIKELEKEGEVTCVHCTHGLNRSGYLICRYMIEALEIEPQTAIRLFEDARGYKIERQNYIDDLMARKPGFTQDGDHEGQTHDNMQNGVTSHHGHRRDVPQHHMHDWQNGFTSQQGHRGDKQHGIAAHEDDRTKSNQERFAGPRRDRGYRDDSRRSIGSRGRNEVASGWHDSGRNEGASGWHDSGSMSGWHEPESMHHRNRWNDESERIPSGSRWQSSSSHHRSDRYDGRNQGYYDDSGRSSHNSWNGGYCDESGQSAHRYRQSNDHQRSGNRDYPYSKASDDRSSGARNSGNGSRDGPEDVNSGRNEHTRWGENERPWWGNNFGRI